MTISIVGFIFSLLGALVAGLIVGFIVTRNIFKRQLEKNPPINEGMIRAMMSQMGRTPSEKQVRQVMASMKAEQDKGNKKSVVPTEKDAKKDKKENSKKK